MEAKNVYDRLEKDFILPGLIDDWSFVNFGKIDRVTDDYKIRFMGLVFDFAKEINSVFTAVSPSDKVINELIEKDIKQSMLFVHHPVDWDTRKEKTFNHIPDYLVDEMQTRNISLYNLHSPLDNYSAYSTSKTLTDAIGLEEVGKFAEYAGGLAGIITSHNFSTVDELAKHFSEVLGHKVRIILNGDIDIIGKNIGIVAGGGVDMDVMSEMRKLNLNTLITGVSLTNIYTESALKYAEENRINIISGTHYSTEKFACIAMVDYFKNLGLESEFIEDIPLFEDL